MAPAGLIGGIDVGGTKILAAITDGRGRVLASGHRPTGAQESPDAVIGRMAEAILEALGALGQGPQGLSGVGLAIAGPCDLERGLVTSSPNLPGWRDVPAARLLQERLGVPAHLENDATAATWGEYHFGVGRGSRHMLYLAIGTGIGGGIVVDGRLYRGAAGAAGELGHVSIQEDGPLCHCGSRGCLEALASGWALAQGGKELVARSRAPTMARLAQEAGGVTAEVVHQAALSGEAEALRIIEEAGRHLGVALANFVNIFNPEVIAIGGGLSQMGEILLAPARRTMMERAFALPAGLVRVEVGQLGELAGVLGVGALVRERMAPSP
ncbi:MAG TPA: ROK family protein [Dehalococcoidia bacterium]|nr:ROK family protein [Dehalococcoidia bacterium]